MKFFYCSHCGNIVIYAKDKGVPVVCCGDEMRELTPKNSSSEDYGGHTIQVSSHHERAIVLIGDSEPHPMTPAHFIEWVVLETTEGYQRKELGPMKESTLMFSLCPNDEVVAAYAYCNRCGLGVSD